MLLLQSVDDCSQSQYFCFSRHVVEVPSVRGMSAILTVTGSNPAKVDEEIELVQIRLVAEEILWHVRMVIHILLHFLSKKINLKKSKMNNLISFFGFCFILL